MASGNESFDFIIIGGGTSGLVLASRITEDPGLGRVLVVEAGEDQTQDPRVNVPAMWPTLLSTSSNWDFKTVPQHRISGSANVVPQGRLLGGSSALNGLSFVPPSKATIDAWAGLGNPGWDWPAFSKSLAKSYTLSGNGTSQRPDSSGPLQLTVPDETNDWRWPEAWQNTLKSIGIPVNRNPYSSSGEFYGAAMVADAIDQPTKQRSYAGNAYYLGLAKDRENLTVWTGVTVTRILFDHDRDIEGNLRATGIQYISNDDRVKTITASKEVIVAAGAINSPKLLELSGIGDRRLLEPLGITPLIDNPSVGENLQNHPLCTLAFKLRNGGIPGYETMDNIARQDPAALGVAMEAYTTKLSGPFSRSGTNSIALLGLPGADTDDGERVVKELLAESTVTGSSFKTTPEFGRAQEHFMRSILESNEPSGHYLSFGGFVHFDRDGSMAGPPPGNDSFFSIGISLAHPISRGSVHISSPSTSVAPVIDPNYFSHPLDIEVMARHLQFISSTISKAEPLASHLTGKLGNSSVEVDKLESLNTAREFIRNTAVGAYHFAGTCAMMSRELGGVVDSKLRVYGSTNLRVCDASIIPMLSYANPQATVYGVAEHGAQIIRSHHDAGKL
ncbi:hypothetical protein VMCG_09088 [Cytospora schulzeri]|uniref:Glucose-methanol-choline oxidoreductase N-terminal domain-containing protein n=1 Tax=Cytospora schulzeri TaxID=448051 RepID=A0A423VP27_9PEZI|nr:hypothetical protein VMCG_09088 [Valsa malicola]